MPRVSNEAAAQFWEPDAIGPIAQVELSKTVTPGPTIAAGATFNSGVLYADGFKVIAAAVKMDQAGTLTVIRYLDEAGALQQGAPASVAVIAGSTAIVNVNDGLPFIAYRVTLQNTGGSAATVAAWALLLNAN